MSARIKSQPSKFASYWQTLDALEVGETWEFKPDAFARCKTPPTAMASMYLKVSGRAVRMHRTTRGFMFVRIE